MYKRRAVAYISNRRDDVVFAAETHLNKEASLKLITDCRKHGRNAAASPAIANLDDAGGDSAGMIVTTRKYIDNTLLQVGADGVGPNTRLIATAIMCRDTCTILASVYFYAVS